LPTSYFTTQVVENWTHTESALLGGVILDVDWAVDLDGLREHLRTVAEDSPLWDGRVCVVQMVDAVGGYVTIRALVSATDAPSLLDLRCHVREGLAARIRDAGTPPRTRAETHSESSELNSRTGYALRHSAVMTACSAASYRPGRAVTPSLGRAATATASVLRQKFGRRTLATGHRVLALVVRTHLLRRCDSGNTYHSITQSMPIAAAAIHAATTFTTTSITTNTAHTIAISRQISP
jgi:hypothetical protein